MLVFLLSRFHSVWEQGIFIVRRVTVFLALELVPSFPIYDLLNEASVIHFGLLWVAFDPCLSYAQDSNKEDKYHPPRGMDSGMEKG
jgi:hypothetical protein